MFNQAVILAGGKGTRFLEETKFIPKPMIKANDIPLLMYVIEHYKKFKVQNFYVLTGYKQNIIEEYFANLENYIYKDGSYNSSDGTKVYLVDTGLDTLTSGRLKIVMEQFKFENFYLTYGDGVSNVDIDKLTSFHMENNTIGTVTAVNPPPRFGLLEIKENQVIKVREKNEVIPTWINGGYFVLNKNIYNYLSDHEALEDKPLMNLSKDNQLSAYKHYGYWQCVDTIRELEIFESDLNNQKYIL